MSVGQNSKLRIVSILAGMAFSLAGWMYLSTPEGTVFLQELTGKQIDVLPDQPPENVVALPQTQILPSNAEPPIQAVDLPFYESALFGMQEAIQSMTSVVGSAMTLDNRANSSFKSSDREMVRNVGGAKFVSNR
ncbi:MAG: hypothetical protein AAFP98_03695 [Pseudomonadota bacterium]